MPTHLRHRHRLGHGPCSTRLRALGPTRIAARLRPRPQGTAERRTHRRLYQDRPLRLTSAVHNTAPEAVGNTFHDSPDGPERHDLPRPGRHVAPAGRHTQATGHDVDRNRPDLRLRRRRMSSHYFLRRRSIDRQRKKTGWRQHNLFHQGTADDVQPHFFRGDLRADSRRNHTDELASTDAWHQFLSSTRVAGLDAGVMG